ncbi:hypothetical protein A1O3_04949 [Capronia epimyces CBS 606.96]|uniref:Oxidoreductase acuF-like C2H2 type zinc-finger domain-containing protein n=1 Tax=Capronia epimyces CBS 606.96 TaxID=1182542 RepID=W9XUP2_9EURO|nr:uncharacterized protein A1O3_04949 [Capronia epimyces CBS 606.96]EXJ84282.1 hypothetical protein A1O3_04949 [Capronia epimyces CBS 606.96]
MDHTSISSELLEVLKAFNTILLDDSLFHTSLGIPKSSWTDELGRLRVWAANIGAHQKGHSSLDYRLRDASHIKTQIVNLLRSFKRALRDLEEVLTALSRKEPLAEEDAKGRDENMDEDDATAEVEDIFLHITEVISNLYRLSMLVRQPSQQDRLLRYRKDDALGYEPFDRQHVLEKLPKADSSVIDRLGTAISNRRRDLKGLERHRAKLAKGISHAHLDHHDGVSTVMSGTLATEYKEEDGTARLEAESVGGESAASSASSFLADGQRIKIPPPPLGYGSEQFFECPYCFLITTADSRQSWARHVFRDLRPYLCVFPDCSTPSQLYDRRRDWFLHLQTNHLRASTPIAVATCPLCGENELLHKQLKHHLAIHLEELALFALPRDIQDDEDDDDATEDDRVPAWMSEPFGIIHEVARRLEEERLCPEESSRRGKESHHRDHQYISD